MSVFQIPGVPPVSFANFPKSHGRLVFLKEGGGSTQSGPTPQYLPEPTSLRQLQGGRLNGLHPVAGCAESGHIRLYLEQSVQLSGPDAIQT
jgi:hypothetical protein